MNGSTLSAGPVALKQAAMRVLIYRALEWRLSIASDSPQHKLWCCHGGHVSRLRWVTEF